MTEYEWFSCTDPNLMLTSLSGKVADRKLRLFAVACCRDIWDLLPDQRSRTAVEVAERYADGLAGERERAAARAAAVAPTGRGTAQAAWAAYWAVSHKLDQTIWNTCEAAVEGRARRATHSAHAEGQDWGAAWETARTAAVRDQALLLRDVLGNPFRPALRPGYLDWRGGLLASMAREIYESRDFFAMSILADALEDAGCDDPEVLAHCRAELEHVRGCWALDLILGRG
jgi:hypothetical protein